ncbi:hypothetical protein F511_34309 [Dorcoceras hygrometricum]|uniref:Uncharacterized protein n=1 Tax=Dorcoceras hygrometricum TaxID=472368 RepID=A0A2Z7CYV2_9LAMI|nr:hypothetical protein F511_34309 [Dorcoceras hygrometricum]
MVDSRTLVSADREDVPQPSVPVRCRESQSSAFRSLASAVNRAVDFMESLVVGQTRVRQSTGQCVDLVPSGTSSSQSSVASQSLIRQRFGPRGRKFKRFSSSSSSSGAVGYQQMRREAKEMKRRHAEESADGLREQSQESADSAGRLCVDNSAVASYSGSSRNAKISRRSVCVPRRKKINLLLLKKIQAKQLINQTQETAASSLPVQARRRKTHVYVVSHTVAAVVHLRSLGVLTAVGCGIGSIHAVVRSNLLVEPSEVEEGEIAAADPIFGPTLVEQGRLRHSVVSAGFSFVSMPCCIVPLRIGCEGERQYRTLTSLLGLVSRYEPSG